MEFEQRAYLGLYRVIRMKNQMILLIVSAVVIVAAVSIYSLTGPTGGTFGSTSSSSSLTTKASTGITQTVVKGSFTPPNGCGTIAKTVQAQGYNITTYVSSTSPKGGDTVCIDVVVQYVNGRVVTQAANQVQISWNITDSNGVVVNENNCGAVAPPPNPSSLTAIPFREQDC